MTWLKFFICLTILYVIYYSVMIFWDYLRSSRSAVDNDEQELTFLENVVPVVVEEREGAIMLSSVSSPVVASGGVSLKEVFRLAQEEVIEYIRPVSF